MRGAQRSVKNTAKNVSLIVLVVLLLSLCAANWLTGLNIAQTTGCGARTTICSAARWAMNCARPAWPRPTRPRSR